jgi:hypothetical protein
MLILDVVKMLMLSKFVILLVRSRFKAIAHVAMINALARDNATLHS